MKLRCASDSVRIRVVKSDLDQLIKDGKVEEMVHFGSGPDFSFTLESSQNALQPDIIFEQSKLRIILPLTMCEGWALSDQIGIEHFKNTGLETKVQILVEKDFPCKDREEEDHADTFWELSEKEGKTC